VRGKSGGTYPQGLSLVHSQLIKQVNEYEKIKLEKDKVCCGSSGSCWWLQEEVFGGAGEIWGEVPAWTSSRT
jgi:Fe-S oxidoreductase